MKKRLTRIAPLRAGIVLGILYAFLGLLFSPLFLLMAVLAPKTQGGGAAVLGGVAMSLLMPFFYGAIGFLGGLLASALYNLIAKWTGGFQIELVDDEVTIP